MQGLEADAFVEGMKRAGKRVPGIGHRIKSKDNRDARVELLQVYAREHFPSSKYLEYALTVEVCKQSQLVSPACITCSITGISTAIHAAKGSQFGAQC